MRLICLFIIICLQATICFADSPAFTTLNATNYHQVVASARTRVSQILTTLKPYQAASENERIAQITTQLINTPYLYSNAMGEGDWQPDAQTYQPLAVHINQNPVYRFDGMDCQTFVQDVLALLHAHSLNTFDRNLIHLAYGAVNNSDKDRIHVYNRNHFIDADFNPVNEQNGILQDVTSQGELSHYMLSEQAMVQRQNWFKNKLQQTPPYVRVLDKKNGLAMVRHLQDVVAYLSAAKFKQEKVVMTYLPKTQLILWQNGSLVANPIIFNHIPTPAVLEVVNDIKRWRVRSGKVSDVIGSELTVSHMGVLYRQRFQHGELIYEAIRCEDGNDQPVCRVTPVYCQAATCNELMFAHATDAYPVNYYWYALPNGQHVCTANLPAQPVAHIYCNRVERLPLAKYLTQYEFGYYTFMQNRAILGVHIEKIL